MNISNDAIHGGRIARLTIKSLLINVSIVTDSLRKAGRRLSRSRLLLRDWSLGVISGECRAHIGCGALMRCARLETPCVSSEASDYIDNYRVCKWMSLSKYFYIGFPFLCCFSRHCFPLSLWLTPAIPALARTFPPKPPAAKTKTRV